MLGTGTGMRAGTLLLSTRCQVVTAAGPLKQLLKNYHSGAGGGVVSRHLAGLSAAHTIRYTKRIRYLCATYESAGNLIATILWSSPHLLLYYLEKSKKISRPLSLSCALSFGSISIRRVCINVASRQQHRQRSNF